jgi:hypothetical protein
MIGDTVVYEYVFGSINKDSLLTHKTNSTRINPGGVVTAYNYCYNFFEKPEKLISYMCDKYTLSDEIFSKIDNTPKITQYITENGNKIFQSIDSNYINNFEVYSKLKDIKYSSICVLYDMGIGTLDSIEKCISILLNKNCTILVYSKKYTECRGVHYLLIDHDDYDGNWESYLVKNLLVVKNNKISTIYNSENPEGKPFNNTIVYSPNTVDISAIILGLLAGSINANNDLYDSIEYINNVLQIKLNTLDYIYINKNDIRNQLNITKIDIADKSINIDIINMLKNKFSKTTGELHVYTTKEDNLSILQNFAFINKAILYSKNTNINTTYDTRTEPILIQQM